MQRKSLCVVIILLLFLLVSCGGNTGNSSPESSNPENEQNNSEGEAADQFPNSDDEDPLENEIGYDEVPDLIFHNGRVITMDPDIPDADAVAIRNGIFIAVGDNAGVLALAGDQTKVIDLEGYVLTPGFIDSHSHRTTQKHKWGFGTHGEVAEEATSQGWTSMSELLVNRDEFFDIIQASERGEIGIRLNLYLAHNSFSGEDFGDWYTSFSPGQQFGSYVRIAGIKIFIDYDSGRTLLLEPDVLNLLVQQLQVQGWQVSMKSVSTQSNDLALNAIDFALNGEDNEVYRYRLEHSTAATDEQMHWMAEKGIIACIQPGLPAVMAHDPDMYQIAIENGIENSFRWKDYQEAGVFLVASPLNPQVGIDEHFENSHISPIGIMYRGITRIGINGSEPEDWMLGQSLTAEDIFKMLTINGAYSTFEEDFKGSLTPGKWADMVVFSGNPLEVETDELLNISTLMTMISGEVVYCKDGYESLYDGDNAGAALDGEEAIDVQIPSGDLIKLAVQGPVSGSLSGLFPAMQNTVNLAIEEFDWEGDEFPIELIVVDDQCDQGKAAEVAAETVEGHPDLVAVIGPLCSSGVRGSFPIYGENGILIISGSNTKEELSGIFGKDGYNRTIPHEGQLAQIGAVEGYLNSSPDVQDFFTRYEQQFGAIPDDVRSYLPYTYDAVHLLLASIEKTSTMALDGSLIIERLRLLTALRSIHIDGLTGTVSIDENGNRILP